ASCADHGTKVDVIRNNRHKYVISAMCKVLQIPRSTYYYEAKTRDNQDEALTNLIITIFKSSRDIYGQRKIKKELEKHDWQVSRQRIGRIMNEQGLISKYTVAQFKPHKTLVNESEI